MACQLLYAHPHQETSPLAACWVKQELSTFVFSTLCVLSAGYDTKMWSDMAQTIHVFEHNIHYMEIAKNAVGKAHNVVFHNASLKHRQALPLDNGICNVTVVDSSLDYQGGYHRQKAMQEGVRVTGHAGIVFLDDANRQDEQTQLKRYCLEYNVRKIRNGFARCLPKHKRERSDTVN